MRHGDVAWDCSLSAIFDLVVEMPWTWLCAMWVGMVSAVFDLVRNAVYQDFLRYQSFC